jgi:hypothetical protein
MRPWQIAVMRMVMLHMLLRMLMRMLLMLMLLMLRCERHGAAMREAWCCDARGMVLRCDVRT